MGLEVGIVGLPRAGKTTLFNALTRAGAATHDAKAHVGMAEIADPRLADVARIDGSAKATPAVIRVEDVPGTGAALLGNLRRVDALLCVVDGYSPGADPAGDLEQLSLELLVADRDHVEARLERVRTQAKSGDARLRSEAAALEALLAHLDSGGNLCDSGGEVPEELEPLTTKPRVVVENGPGGIDLAFELELSELGGRGGGGVSRGPVRARRGRAEAARRARPDHVLHRRRDRGARVDAAAGPDGAGSRCGDSLRHGARLHSLRGDSYRRSRRDRLARRGRTAWPAAVGRQGYVVADGDVLHIRFSP